MPSTDSYSEADVTTLNTHRTPIKKQSEALLCLVGLSRSYFLGDDVYPTFLYDDDRDIDLFNLIRAPNPTKKKTGTRPRAAHGVPLLTATASRVIDMEDPAVVSRSSGTPPSLEKSPLDFADEDIPQRITERGAIKDQVQDELSHGIAPVENATTTKVVLEPSLEKEVAAMGPRVNKRCRKKGNDEVEASAPPKVLGKDHAAFHPAQSTLGGKSLAPLGLDAGSTFATPVTQEAPTTTKSVSDPDPLTYAKPQPHPELDIAPSFRKTTTEVPTKNVATKEVQGPFSTESPESGKSTSFPSMDGSPGDHIVSPRYFFELCHLQNTDFLSQYNINLAQHVAMGSQLRLRFEQEIKSLRVVEAEVHGLRNQTKNLETLLEAKVDMKKATEAKKAELAKELESLRVQFLDLLVSNRLNNVAEMDARLDKLSVDFDKELYPHMLTAISGRRWVIRHGLRLAVMKCAESLELRQAFADVVSAGLVKGPPRLEGSEVPIGGSTREWIRDLRPSSSQLKIPIYPKVCDPEDPWKCMVVCRTHEIGSIHHARSDGIPVSVPTIAPQGMAILLADAAIQTEVVDKEDVPHH
nr:hypothetical protein [Tanacetum cinerariifolium]